MSAKKPIELNTKNVVPYVESLLSRIPSFAGTTHSIATVEEVTEQTYVNYIFRAALESEGQTLDIYLRQSRDHVKAAPEKKVDAARTGYETQILELINTIVPGLVPDVLYHDEDHNIAVLSDIKRGCPLLVNELIEGRAHPETGAFFGDAIATIHGETYGIAHSKVRGSAKENKDAVDFHLGMRLDPAQDMEKEAVKKLLTEGKQARKCLVLGDLASKNIFIDGEKARFLDLERSFVGDPAFDPAFLFCHYLIEVKPENLDDSLAFIDNFMKAYRKKARKYLSAQELKALESRILRYLGITILYRLFGFYLVVNVERKKNTWNKIARDLLKEDRTNVTEVLKEKIRRF